MSNLAIRGHATRGKEVIEILEMLGGRNVRNYACNLTDYAYSINGQGIIDWYIPHPNSPLVIYTLEEFLEKYPYKVGDKVHHIIDNENQIITDLVWDEDEVLYKTTNNFGYVYVNYLQPYKEETMEDKDIIKPTTEINLNHPCFDGRNEIELIIPKGWAFKQRDGKMFGVRKQYPKTYEECCNVLGVNPSFDIRMLEDEESALYFKFIDLVRCRNAYWKIAGEQMGLGEPWKPDWLNTEQDKFVLYTHNNVICLNRFVLGHNVLAFPTAEMRDAFLENFKDLIELCKELL